MTLSIGTAKVACESRDVRAATRSLSGRTSAKGPAPSQILALTENLS